MKNSIIICFLSLSTLSNAGAGTYITKPIDRLESVLKTIVGKTEKNKPCLLEVSKNMYGSYIYYYITVSTANSRREMNGSNTSQSLIFQNENIVKNDEYSLEMFKRGEMGDSRTELKLRYVRERLVAVNAIDYNIFDVNGIPGSNLNCYFR